MFTVRHLAQAATAVLAVAGLTAPAAAQNLDPNFNQNLNLQQLQNPSVDVRQMRIEELQRQVEVTVPYRISNLPPGITQASISCSFTVRVTLENGDSLTYPSLRQEVSLSAGSANGTLTLSGPIPGDDYFETRSDADIESMVTADAEDWRCGFFFNGPDFAQWLYGKGYCDNTNMCAGANRTLLTEGQF
jgi:hypothetical protein